MSTEGLEASVQTLESDSHTEHMGIAERGKRDMAEFLTNPIARERFAKTQIAKKLTALGTLGDNISKAAEGLVNQLIDTEAQKNFPGLSLEECKKKGKEWGEARKSVKEINVLIEEDDAHIITALPIAEARSMIAGTIAWEGFSSEIEAALTERQDELSKQMEVFDKLHAEFEAEKDSPRLKTAMEVWGISPNAAQEKDVDGKLIPHHAGVIHYFEYRTIPEKNARFEYNPDAAPCSIDGFCAYSERMAKLIQDAQTPEGNPDVIASSVISDDQNQERLYMAMQANGKGELIVGFRRPEETNLRIVSIIPGGDAKIVTKNTLKELKPEEPGTRLNALGGSRHLKFKSANVEVA